MIAKLVRSHTFIGSGALLLWIVQPLLVTELEGFPLFEALTIIFGSGFLISAIRITLAKRWRVILKQPLFVWILGVVGICCGDFCYLLGAYSAPVAHIDLIDYIWPCLFVVIVSFFPNQKFSWKYLLGSFVGLFGVCLLISGGNFSSGFHTEFVIGYLLATYGVLVWGLYSMYSCYRTEIPTDMVGVYCGIGAVITAILHVKFEATVMPTSSQTLMTVVLTLAGPGFAYQLWDHGIKYGNARLLGTMSYLARVLAISLLVWFGKEPFTNSLVAACILTVVGVVICTMQVTMLKKIIFSWLRFGWLRPILTKLLPRTLSALNPTALTLMAKKGTQSA